MFSVGQWVFAGIFVVAFTVIIILSYKGDKKMHAKNYKGVKWVGISFVLFIILLFFIKHLLKN